MSKVKPVVFIHTNDKQFIGAKVAEYALKSKSARPDSFDVKIIRLEETPHLNSRDGKTYLRKGRSAVWNNTDLQSFSPLRMMVPQLMNFTGRALVIDPDVFAVGDVCELLESDMQNKAIVCRHISDGYKNNGNSFYATSVMLLDCKKLKHWKWDNQIDQMFEGVLDYGDWISLKLEDKNTIGGLPEEWNHFDILNDKTKLLHNTERSTQPWKTGLEVDYDTNWGRQSKINNFLENLLSLKISTKKFYRKHPDPQQELFFLTLLRDSLKENIVSKQLIELNIANKNVRADIFFALEGVG